jgi:lipoprotein-anchoring transpeptidase ErfK/SrfK
MNIKKTLIPITLILLIAILSYGVFFIGRPGNSSGKMAKTTINESPERLMARAGWLVIEGKRDQAKEIYEQVVEKYSDGFLSKIADARLKEEGYEDYFMSLDETNSDVYVVKMGDSLGKIAKGYGVTAGTIRTANRVQGDRIRPYQELKIMKDKWRILVDKSTNILILKAGDRIVKTYPVGTGKGGGTPVGDFTIVNRLKNPTWYYEGTVAGPNDPGNPLGTRWLGFDIHGYGLHGTRDPDSIGKYETLGCIRMRNEDVEEIFELLTDGTPVTVIESSLDTNIAKDKQVDD